MSEPERPPQAPQPFGTPVHGGRPAPRFAPPVGWEPPPQGYGPWIPHAGSIAQSPASGPSRPANRRASSGLGVVSFILAAVAAVFAPVLAGIAGFRVGAGGGRVISRLSTSSDVDWSALSPVREWVLLGEVAFWAGTVLGVWAIVQGSLAIARNRGRGWGIAAVIIAVIAPLLFAAALWLLLFAGLATDPSIVG